MKLSTRARYGLSCMITVSRLSTDGSPVSLERVARNTGLSKRYLEQLAIALKHAGLLQAVSGRRGGYHLARPATEIRLGEIVEATIGPINIVECVRHPERCTKADQCSNRVVWMLLNQKICETLDGHTLQNLSDDEGIRTICGELEPGTFIDPTDEDAADVMPDCARWD
jgi:Rrf2 family iron-sulfur cluster assembly transcriptional regulator